MKLDTVKTMMQRDSEIDSTNLDIESLRIPMLHGKWYGIFMDEARIYRAIQSDISRMKKEKTEYYLGKADDAVYKERPLNLKILRQDLDLYMDADPDLLNLYELANNQKIKIDMIESFIKSLSTRGYNIKSAIDFLKFKNGML